MDELNFKKETEQIKARYNRRSNLPKDLYNPLKADVIYRKQELERNLIKILSKYFLYDLSELKLLEIGCGQGSNLLKFIELGFKPENLFGNELLQERVIKAKKILPSEVKIIEGDALNLKFESGTFDIIFQSTVFSSIINEEFKKRLAEKIYDLLKPGGGVLWYDFIYNNPNNTDVKGISKRSIKNLFPNTTIYFKKMTLAPPLGRIVTRVNPALYYFFNFFPFLRTHLLCWIQKS
ncbi:MAG: class I SAM-dependent methyltransferase [Ignavibacteriaceae bacterium]